MSTLGTSRFTAHTRLDNDLTFNHGSHCGGTRNLPLVSDHVRTSQRKKYGIKPENTDGQGTVPILTVFTALWE